MSEDFVAPRSYCIKFGNPPFGGEEEKGILNNFPADKQTAETALLFLQLIMRKLKRPARGTPGRAAVVVPNGTLFGDLCSLEKGSSPTLKTEAGQYPLVVTASYRRSSPDHQFDKAAVCIPLISSTGHGNAAIHRIHYQDGKFALANLLVAAIPRDDSQLDAKFLWRYPFMPPTIQPIYLLADSQLLFWQRGDALFLDSIRALVTARSPKAAYIGASSDDEPGYFEIFKAAMAQVRTTDCRMIPSTYSKEDAAYLQQADLILLGGGDVEEGWRTIEETGMRGAILRRYREGAVLIGTSAGAVQLGLCGCSPGESSNNALFDTFQLVPFLVDTQNERDGWSRLAETVELLGEDVKGLGIPTGGGMILHPNGDLEPVRTCVDLFRVGQGRLQRSILLPLDACAGER